MTAEPATMVDLPDGRKIEVRTAGPEDGEILLFHVTGDLAEWLLENGRVGLAHGVAGWRDDDLAFAADWGFDLRDVQSVAIWQGAQDRMVPYAHGVWLADHVPGARRRLLSGEGHLSMAIGLFDSILDDLFEM